MWNLTRYAAAYALFALVSTVAACGEITAQRWQETVDAATRYALEPELLAALVWQESRYCETAVSPAGAIGLGQLMPATALELGVDPWQPLENLDGAARYLRTQLDAFGSLELALAAYNAGPQAVKRYDGVPPFKETQAYVPAVLGYFGGFQQQRSAEATQVEPASAASVEPVEPVQPRVLTPVPVDEPPPPILIYRQGQGVSEQGLNERLESTSPGNELLIFSSSGSTNATELESLGSDASGDAMVGGEVSGGSLSLYRRVEPEPTPAQATE